MQLPNMAASRHHQQLVPPQLSVIYEVGFTARI